MAQCVNNFVPEKEMSAIPFQFCSMLCYPFRVATAPVLESMRAREPGLQAPSNLAGSKIKNTHFSPLINSFSEISNIGKRTHHVICTYSEGKAIKPMNLKFFAKYSLLQAPSKHENRLAGSGGDSRTGATAAVHEAVTGSKWDRRRETRNLGTKIDKDRCSELLLL